MAVSTRGKRKIVHKNDTYYWWVDEDYDCQTGHFLLVTVVSEDKTFLVKYYINQTTKRFLTVLGHNFTVNNTSDRGWKWFACPQFGEVQIFKPKNVINLIDWCLDAKAPKIRVGRNGNKLD